MTDTVKHMWDQVEKARADGTFSSEHAAVPAQGAKQHLQCERCGDVAIANGTLCDDCAELSAPLTPAEGEEEEAPSYRDRAIAAERKVMQLSHLVETANARLRQLKDSIDTRINNLLCETKPNYDDSIVGINDAWDVVRKACDEYIARAERPNG